MNALEVILALVGILLFGYGLSGQQAGSPKFFVSILGILSIILSITLWLTNSNLLKQ